MSNYIYKGHSHRPCHWPAASSKNIFSAKNVLTKNVMVHILALYSRPYFIYFKGPCGSWRRPQRRSGNMASNLLRYSLGPWSFSVRNCQLIKEPTVHDITSVPFTSLYFWNRYVSGWSSDKNLLTLHSALKCHFFRI